MKDVVDCPRWGKGKLIGNRGYLLGNGEWAMSARGKLDQSIWERQVLCFQPDSVSNSELGSRGLSCPVIDGCSRRFPRFIGPPSAFFCPIIHRQRALMINAWVVAHQNLHWSKLSGGVGVMVVHCRDNG